jgi:hypothetical protein
LPRRKKFFLIFSSYSARLEIIGEERRGVMDLPSFPKCQKCETGALIPLSDYGQEGASVLFKAWVCTNPDCGFSLRVDKGEVTYGKRIEPKH